ncbi:mandelate racemase/muconate lactonizing enzyme family protein [Roseibium album]|uniref:L-Ala-D/L-Glu epimerase n=1 Tax=Roseibium album TaxID=311410 RepID=A0A0M7AYR6_9HYPH|nr:enolase C-terminal domain-like protein [Roseibium album]MBG6166527.1 L-alanine-DL-glutamate epimerase-like enolase superfamily enzyme [Labrenzia sp. EL_195]MBG6202080.1 L-alanine-DL-glutamate epimerase-like enolase superfamily enzyme [Labrenzia sp. EL_13]CTQ63179.1 L-Ala-D/L-Glu epimerase [Roseibium album]CTQ79350.1 L-Ala-D/L-Glu epimerase [Roseibium album]CTQ80725.1 L-Ala-D/L-Glu epimerase [Roseibium album]
MTNFPDFRISGLTLWRVPLTSHETYNMASGKTCATVDSMVLRIETDQGISGWGEVCPIPHYLPAYANGVAPALEELAPVLIGANPVGVDALMAACKSHLLGHPYAQSAIDIALWDLTGKACGVPVYTLLGGQQNQDLPLYHSITCIAPEEMARIAKEAISAGMRQIQVKLGADDNWEADVARLRFVREAAGAGPLVYGDWNCGASRLDATRVGRAVSDLDIMLEQPCATLEECAAVRHATNLPMKLDENAHDTATLLKAYELGCMDAVALKLSKFGGISELRRARDLCLYFGARMCIEDTWGSDVATAAALHVAAATPPKAIMNVCDLSGYVSPRIDADAPVRSKGRISPPVGPGLGVWPDADALGVPVLSIAA